MTPDEIFALITKGLELAFQVRLAQKRYFKTRQKDDLITAKMMENRLDQTLKELGYDLENQPAQVQREKSRS